MYNVWHKATYSAGVVVGWPECFSVLGVVTSCETVLTSIVEVWDTISDEWVGVGIVDLLLVSYIHVTERETHRSISDNRLESGVIVVVQE